jgi:hypothetical protein
MPAEAASPNPMSRYGGARSGHYQAVADRLTSKDGVATHGPAKIHHEFRTEIKQFGERSELGMGPLFRLTFS